MGLDTSISAFSNFFGYLLQKHLDKTEEEEQVDLKYFLR